MDEPAPPRPARGAELAAALKEDLDHYSVGDLRERIEGLQAEIARVEAILKRKGSDRAQADALFSGLN